MQHARELRDPVLPIFFARSAGGPSSRAAILLVARVYHQQGLAGTTHLWHHPRVRPKARELQHLLQRAAKLRHSWLNSADHVGSDSMMSSQLLHMSRAPTSGRCTLGHTSLHGQRMCPVVAAQSRKRCAAYLLLCLAESVIHILHYASSYAPHKPQASSHTDL